MRPGSRFVTVLISLVLLAPWARGQDAGTQRRASARLPSARRNPLLAPHVLRGFFRPTVTIRKGNSRGSGTIVASTRDETLILTAAHVVADPGNLEIELQPYNYGIEKDERRLTGSGPWPRLAPAEIVAADPPADVAFVRVKDIAPMPYVAHLDLNAGEPAKQEILTSIGVVGGKDLTGWRTDIYGQALIDLPLLTKRGQPGDPRAFTVTIKPPEFGRSGGALFRADGDVVGVAVGRLRINEGPEIGVFASMASIRKLAAANQLETALKTAKPNATRFDATRSTTGARPK